MKDTATGGFTLLELLITISIVAIIAAAALPILSSNDPQKLLVAAEVTANTLRFALSEARRTRGYVLVDGKKTVGHLKLYSADATGTPGAAIMDPLTKRELDIDIGGSAFSQGVIPTMQFMAGGAPRSQLVIGATGSGFSFQGMDGAGTRNTLQANSGVLLSYGTQSLSVSINEITGLVVLP